MTLSDSDVLQMSIRDLPPVLLFCDERTPRDDEETFLNVAFEEIALEFYRLIVVSSVKFGILVEAAQGDRFVAFSRLWKACGARAMVVSGGPTLCDAAAVAIASGQQNPGERCWLRHVLPQNLPLFIRKKFLSIDSWNEAHDYMLTHTLVDSVSTFLSQRHPDHPLISIFTPTFHSGKRIDRVLKSLQSQTYVNWQWVIVDDSKTDEMVPKLESMAADDLRISYYRLGHSGFIGESKSRATSLCSKESIAFVEMDHDDCLFKPNVLETAVEILVKNPNVGCVYSDFAMMYEAESEDDKPKPHVWAMDTAYGQGGYFRHFIQQYGWQNVYVAISPKKLTNIVLAPNHVRIWRRDVFEKVGGYNPQMSIADDFELLHRMQLNGCDWVRIPGPIYGQYFNADGNNFTFKKNSFIQHTWAVVGRKYCPHYDKFWETFEQKQGHASASALQPDMYDNPNVSIWLKPGVAYPHYEWTWDEYRRQLWRPSRDADTCGAIKRATSAIPVNECLERLSDCNWPNRFGSSAQKLRAALEQGQVTLAVLVNDETTEGRLHSMMTALSPFRNELPIFVVGTPASVTEKIMTSMEIFPYWCFRIGDLYIPERQAKEWVSMGAEQKNSIMANYAIKMGARSAYILYLDASRRHLPPVLMELLYETNLRLPVTVEKVLVEPANVDGAGSSKITECATQTTRVVVNADPLTQAGVSSSSMEHDDILLWGDVKMVPNSEDLHGFYHHTFISDLYGYWDLQKCSPKQMITRWVICSQIDSAKHNGAPNMDRGGGSVNEAPTGDKAKVIMYRHIPVTVRSVPTTGADSPTAVAIVEESDGAPPQEPCDSSAVTTLRELNAPPTTSSRLPNQLSLRVPQDSTDANNQTTDTVSPQDAAFGGSDKA